MALPVSLASYTALTFSSAGPIPFSDKTCPIKVIPGILELAIVRIYSEAFVFQSLEKLYQSLVMLFNISTMDDDVVCNIVCSFAIM